MFPKSPVRGTFRGTKSGPRIVFLNKGGYLTFHPEISFKKGVGFLSLSLWTPEKLKRGI